MLTIKVTIQGTSPLLCNRFRDRLFEGPLDIQAPPRAQAESKLYRNDKGVEVFPEQNLLRCFDQACPYVKPNWKLSKHMFMEELEVPIHAKPWVVDSRSVRLPGTGQRVMCHRPCFHDWRLSFTLHADEHVISELREVVVAAGKFVGLGDFRPECGGWFGRFIVERWDASEERSAA